MYFCQFSKNFTLPKNGGHFEFSNFCQKLKNTNFLLSKKCTLGNFQKIFLSPKMAAILNFRIFAKNGKRQICFYLLNCPRWINFVEIFHRQGISAIYCCQFCPSFRAKLMLPFGWTVHMPMCPISSFHYPSHSGRSGKSAIPLMDILIGVSTNRDNVYYLKVVFTVLIIEISNRSLHW